MLVKIKRIERLTSGCLLYCSILVFAACSRNTYQEDLSGENAEFLTVQSALEESEDLANSIEERAVTRQQGNTKQNGNSTDDDAGGGIVVRYEEGEGFDAVVSGRESAFEVSQRSDANQNTWSGGTLGRAAIPMSAGIKYRLVLYKQSGNNLVFWRQKQLQSKVGAALDTTQQIEVVRGDSYVWYAYSYNNTADIAPLANTSADASVFMGEHADFLYATGTISIPAQGQAITPLNVLFRHQMARVSVEVDARGMFADEIRQLSGAITGLSGLPLTTGTFRLRDGNISSTVSQPTITNFTIANFQNVELPHNDRKGIFLYSTATIPAFQLGVNLSTIGLYMDDGPTERVFSNANRTFGFNTVEVSRGRTYNARIDLVESPLTVGNVRWARTNLYVHATKTRNPYRFHTTYAHTDVPGSYFPFGSVTPYMYGNGGDPCALVHPTIMPNGQSAWRQPTGAELNALASRVSPASPTFVPNNGLGYFLYPATGVSQPYAATNDLRVNMNGHAVFLSLVNNLITISTPRTNYGSEARLWSSTQLLNVPPLASLGAYYYSGTRFLGANSISTNTLELLSISAIGTNLLQSSFQNVRCVRR